MSDVGASGGLSSQEEVQEHPEGMAVRHDTDRGKEGDYGADPVSGEVADGRAFLNKNGTIRPSIYQIRSLASLRCCQPPS